MHPNYVSYYSTRLGFAVLSLTDSIGDIRAVLGSTGKQIDFVRMKEKQFQSIGYHPADDSRIKALHPYHGTLDPRDAIAGMLKKAPSITKPALERIEMIFETKGKSTEQIRAEIVRISEGLPKGHALRAVPAKFSDRGQAIAAYTQMRQTLYHLSKEKSMSTEAVTEVTPAKAKRASTKAGTTAEAKKPSKAKKEPAAKEPATKKPAAKKAAPKERQEAPSAYKVAGDAVKAAGIADLNMHEGSARAQVMSVVFGNKKRKSFTAEDFAGIEGATTALNYCMKRGWLAAA